MRYTTDVHIHCYTKKDLTKRNNDLPYVLPQPYPLADHVRQLIALGFPPYLICNVHLSILSDSRHVFASLNQFEQLKNITPQLRESRILGFIKADSEYATEQFLD